MIYVHKGHEVRCSYCRTHIYTVRRDLTGWPGPDATPVVGDVFQPVNGSPDVQNDVPNPCPACGHEWFGPWYWEFCRAEFIA